MSTIKKEKKIIASADDTPISTINWNYIKNSQWAIPLLFLGILVLLFSLKLINNLDIGFNLKAGQWVLENKAFPDKDVFTYTVNGNDYIDLHWLYQVILYLTYKFFDYTGLSYLNVILIGITFYLLFRVISVKVTQLFIIVPIMLLTLLTIQIRFSYRPEIISWIGILLILIVLESYYSKGKRKLYYLPVIMLFWVNMHSLFIIGIFITGSYFISIVKEKKQIDKYFLKWFLIASVATFINPYFTKGTFFPVYLSTRLNSSNIFKNTITELKSPWDYLSIFSIEIYLYAAFGILAIILFAVTFKKRKLHELIVLIAFGYISFQSYRNIPIFILYSAYLVAISLSNILNGSKIEKFLLSKKITSKIIPYGLTLVIILVSIRVITNAYYIPYGTGIDFGIGLNNNAFPVKAADFMLQNKMDGRLLNYFSFGSWFMWKLPQPVFIDGRLEVIKEDFYSEYMNSFKAGGLNALIEKYNPDIIAYEHYPGYVWTEQLKTMQNWRLIYWDEIAAVYVKNTYKPELQQQKFEDLAGNYNNINFNENDKIKILNSGTFKGSELWIEGFYKKRERYQGYINMGSFSLDNNSYQLTEKFYLEYLKKTNGNIIEANYKDIYMNLGNTYYFMKNYPYAKLCFQKYLLADPGNVNAVKMLNTIK